MHTQDQGNLLCLDRFIFPTSYARGEKPFGLELESNPGRLAPQATALTTRPCHLGQAQCGDGKEH